MQTIHLPPSNWQLPQQAADYACEQQVNRSVHIISVGSGVGNQAITLGRAGCLGG